MCQAATKKCLCCLCLKKWYYKMQTYFVFTGSRVQYENTFKMEPDHHCEISQVKPIINRILEEIFSSAAYDPLECGVLCKNASTAIKDATKQLRTDRYKYVVTVTCSQNIGQGLKEASRFLWDSQRDNWVDGAFVSPTIQAQAVLYALYYE